MSNETLIRSLQIIDADAHVTEPADLWTSRVATKHRDQVPVVATHPKTGHSHWLIGSTYIWPVGYFSVAGHDKYPPDTPWEYEELDPGCFDPQERLRRLDDYGIHAQTIYPNVIGFQSELIRRLGADLALECVRIYNDFVAEFCSVAPDRLIPIAMLPYWDVEASVTEMERTAAMGHRGVLFANKFEGAGLPHFTDQHWDPIYSAAQDAQIPINYHIGFAKPEWAEILSEESMAKRRAAPQMARDKALFAAGSLFQADTLGPLLISDLCERFPGLSFVSIESAFGWIPFYLEALDWHWKAYGNHEGGGLLPSERFTRQCYGTFWFERGTLDLLKLYPDNFMFSTDYPHGTSLSPGPTSPAIRPIDHAVEAFAHLDPDVATKALQGNARRLYRL